MPEKRRLVQQSVDTSTINVTESPARLLEGDADSQANWPPARRNRQVALETVEYRRLLGDLNFVNMVAEQGLDGE
ncbi:MAG: hypothetical protein JW963_04905 [Anaerolineales bacterium]|nr:hypothetical protein [Anaerolineales bacterium]